MSSKSTSYRLSQSVIKPSANSNVPHSLLTRSRSKVEHWISQDCASVTSLDTVPDYLPFAPTSKLVRPTAYFQRASQLNTCRAKGNETKIATYSCTQTAYKKTQNVNLSRMDTKPNVVYSGQTQYFMRKDKKVTSFVAKFCNAIETKRKKSSKV